MGQSPEEQKLILEAHEKKTRIRVEAAVGPDLTTTQGAKYGPTLGPTFDSIFGIMVGPLFSLDLQFIFGCICGPASAARFHQLVS